MTDRDLAQLALAIYGGSDPHWDYFCSEDEIVWGVKKIDGMTAVVFRGSETPIDFLRDLRVLPWPIEHSRLGFIHPGFLDGMEAVWTAVRAHTEPPWVLAGHSLGAGRTGILAGLMALDGTPPLTRISWGEPFCGGAQLAALTAGISMRSYRNGDRWAHDPITDVPIPLRSALPYRRLSAVADISVSPGFGLSVDWHHAWPIGFHAMELYAKGTPEAVIA